MKTYFENIARAHPQILHNPTEGRVRFFSVFENNISAFRANNEFLNNMHAHPLEPVMVFVNDYNAKLTGTSNDNKWKQYNGQCAILKKMQINTFAAVDTWMQLCKTIIDDIIAQIDFDIRNDNIIRTFNITGLSISTVMNTADNFFGLTLSFNYQAKFCQTVGN